MLQISIPREHVIRSNLRTQQAIKEPTSLTHEFHSIAEVLHSLQSGWLTTGPKTKQFEQN